MEILINDANLNELLGCLQKSLSSDSTTRQSAKKCLESIEDKQNYPLLLLTLVNTKEVDMAFRVAGAITFKNHVKRYWKVEEDCEDHIHSNDRDKVKQFIISGMLEAPELIQRQLSDAVSIISREDFPAKWPHLIPEIVEKFATGDFHIVNGVLHTAHSIFKRYRYELVSEKLWTEIKLVMDTFAKPLTEQFVNTVSLANQHSTNPVTIKVITSSLTLICKIFHSLNSQDLPEHFEDNMETWMKNFLAQLTTDNPLLQTDSDEKAGLAEQLKSQICDNIRLYSSKYPEEFGPYLPQFATTVWKLLVSTGKEVKYDALWCNAIGFLCCVAEWPRYAEFFADPNILHSICDEVIVPNMEFRASDEEIFEENPEEYIRRDIEGSDVDTRRRAACDLVKALSRSFMLQMTEILGRYVAAMLDAYKTNPEANWRSKDTAVHLIIALASKGATQEAQGTTQMNQLAHILGVYFFHAHILSELQQDQVDRLMVLKADALKYLMAFCNQLPRETILASVKPLVDLLRSSSVVVHSYSAKALDKILILKAVDGSGAMFKASDLAGMEQDLLVNLFHAITLPGSDENQYIMKAIMRVFSTLREAVLPFLGEKMTWLNHKLMLVSKNPSKPHFNHYLFETLSLSVRIGCKANRAAVSYFEDCFFPAFQKILTENVQDLLPYVFQILSLMLEFHVGETNVPEAYMAFFPHLLMPVLWEQPANIQPLVRLLQAFVQIGALQVEPKIEDLLGIYQKLLASKTTSTAIEGVCLLQTMIQYLPTPSLETFMHSIFYYLFARHPKAIKFTHSLLTFLFFFTYKYGTRELISRIENLKPGANMFSMVLKEGVISELRDVSCHLERKICAVGLTKLVCETPACYNGRYSALWGALFDNLVLLIEKPQHGTIPVDQHFVEIVETAGDQSASSQLIFVGKKEQNTVPDLPDARVNLATYLHLLSVRYPGTVRTRINNDLTLKSQQFVQKLEQEILQPVQKYLN